MRLKLPSRLGSRVYGAIQCLLVLSLVAVLVSMALDLEWLTTAVRLALTATLIGALICAVLYISAQVFVSGLKRVLGKDRRRTSVYE
jgi:hypothetical protein